MNCHDISQLLPLLACPHCHSGLRLDHGVLRCCRCAADYPLVKGRPVFLAEAASVRVVNADHLSNQMPPDVFDWLSRLNGYALNLGAGGTARTLPNCVEMEYALFRHTDVIGDAHCLPFRDSVFDAVVSFNTFEHLSDPGRAAEEVRRVLKPGGRLVLHTAFLQPLHEAPHHYYNATEFGIRHWFRSFDINELRVSENFQPAYALAWLCSEICRAIEAEQGMDSGELIEGTTLKFWKDAWAQPALRSDRRWDMIQRLSEIAQKRFSAGFHLEATRSVA